MQIQIMGLKQSLDDHMKGRMRKGGKPRTKFKHLTWLNKLMEEAQNFADGIKSIEDYEKWLIENNDKRFMVEFDGYKTSLIMAKDIYGLKNNPWVYDTDPLRRIDFTIQGKHHFINLKNRDRTIEEILLMDYAQRVVDGNVSEEEYIEWSNSMKNVEFWIDCFGPANTTTIFGSDKELYNFGKAYKYCCVIDIGIWSTSTGIICNKSYNDIKSIEVENIMDSIN